MELKVFLGKLLSFQRLVRMIVMEMYLPSLTIDLPLSFTTLDH